MISVRFQGKPFNITEIQDYAPSTNAKEAEAEQFDEDIQDLLELAPSKKENKQTNKKCPFHDRGLECKSKRSRDTWNNRQVWPCSTKLNRAKTNRVLPREYIGHSKHLLPTAKETALHMDVTRWSIPKSIDYILLQSKMEKYYTVSKNKIWS